MSKKPNKQKPRPSKATLRARARRKEILQEIKALIEPILDKLAVNGVLSFEEYEILQRYVPNTLKQEKK